MKNLCVYVLAAVLGGLLGACSSSGERMPPPRLSDLQRASMQSRELPGHFDTAFSAALSVLQDEGWQLDEVGKDSGVIQASSLKWQGLIGPEDDWRDAGDPFIKRVREEAEKAAKKGIPYPQWTRWDRLTAHIEPWQPNSVRVRLTIVKCGLLPSGARIQKKNQITPIPGKEQSVLLEDPAVYQYLFQKLQKAIFVREGLVGK